MFSWPAPALNIVLVEPEIPQNTGNIARLCAATGTILHLIEPLGFSLTDKAVQRAGLDYWNAVEVHRYSNLEHFSAALPGARRFYFSTSGTKNYTEAEFRPGDCLIFGNEGRGLPLDLLADHQESVFNIPIQLDCVRSLNLSNAAAIVLYEALRQCALHRKEIPPEKKI